MNKIGRKLYYDIKTGEVIVDTGEKMGFVVATSVEFDIDVYKALSERNRDTFNVVELPYGAYSQDFASATSYRIKPDTKEIEFAYPSGNENTEEPVYQKPLSEKVVELEQKLGNQELISDTMGQELANTKIENFSLQSQLDLVGEEVTKLKISLLEKGV